MLILAPVGILLGVISFLLEYFKGRKERRYEKGKQLVFEQMEQTQRDIDEISGISDLMRGKPGRLVPVDWVPGCTCLPEGYMWQGESFVPDWEACDACPIHHPD